MQWRKKWARQWEKVKYCSDACRRGRAAQDRQLEQEILRLASQRPTASFCPSEIAQRVWGDKASWPQGGMEAVRQAARRLWAQNALLVCQGGKRIDPTTAKGPIRLRAVPAALRPPES